MVQRIIEQKTAIGHVLSTDRKARHQTPTWQDMVLKVVNKTFTPLADFKGVMNWLLNFIILLSEFNL